MGSKRSLELLFERERELAFSEAAASDLCDRAIVKS
jgi:hypothetical protein